MDDYTIDAPWPYGGRRALAQRMVRAIGALALLGLAGCGGSATEQPSPVPIMAGHWGVSANGGILEFTIAINGTRASGVGRLIDPRGQVTRVTVRGECTHPTFSLDLLAHDHIIGRYVGRYDAGGTLRGVLADSDAPTDSLILVRLLTRAPPPIIRPQWQ